MIFVTIGTHPGQFDRLLRRIDEIAPKVKEKIIIQRGYTRYTPKNCEYFDFSKDIDSYFKKSRIVISQAATSVLELSLKHNKPVILAPRMKKYGEHINDHQVEFAEYFSKKTGVKSITDVKELTPELLKRYNKKAKLDMAGTEKLQRFIIKIISDKR